MLTHKNHRLDQHPIKTTEITHRLTSNPQSTRFQRVFSSQSGMTLVELMVSLTLTTMIIGLVSLMMSQSDRQFRFVSQQENIERQVRAVQSILTDSFRKEAIAEVVPTPTVAPGTTQTPDPNVPIPLFQWKNASGGDGKIQLLGGYLQWSNSTQATADPTIPGATPYMVNTTRTVAEQLHNVTSRFDQNTQQLNLQLEWKMSDGQVITHHWAYTLQRWDQPLIPTPSEEPSPSPTF